ncbi:MAG: phosphotransferase enzyme family protein [Novosphingobium sp.]
MHNIDQEETLYAIAETSLGRWGIGKDASLRLISHSENAVFLVTREDGVKKVLRVHRTDYHSPDGVRSELAWMKALQEQAGVETPQAVAGKDGELIQFVQVDIALEPRMVVLFDFIQGSEPNPDDLLQAFHHLGSIAAQMHAHARCWERPAYFERLIWDYEHSLGDRPNWGGWQAGFAKNKPGRDIVERADAVMRERLARFGTSAQDFGLIHSDLRLANLLVDSGTTKVLDFDDCGLGWYVYDIASSMTFLENHPDVEAIIGAWIEGYRTIGTLTEREIAEIPTFMMLRRLIIMGWAGSHRDTVLAREMGDEYSVGTVEFARKYLDRFTGSSEQEYVVNA